MYDARCTGFLMLSSRRSLTCAPTGLFSTNVWRSGAGKTLLDTSSKRPSSRPSSILQRARYGPSRSYSHAARGPAPPSHSPAQRPSTSSQPTGRVHPAWAGREKPKGRYSAAPEPPYYRSGALITKGTKAFDALGHVRTQYLARRQYFDHVHGRVRHGPESLWPLIIVFLRSCIAEPDLWLEVKVLCDFARALTELEHDLFGNWMDADVAPVEYIIVTGRFHYNYGRPDEPWHLSCQAGNERIWKAGNGYWRHGLHVYANNDNLADGYRGFSRFNQWHRWDGYDDLHTLPTALLHPGVDLMKEPRPQTYIQGTKNYFRSADYRRIVHKATLRELALPPNPLLESHTPGRCMTNTLSRTGNCISEAILTKKLKALQEGMLKPGRPSMGDTVLGRDGKPVPIEQLIAEAETAGDQALRDLLLRKLEGFKRRSAASRRMREMDRTLRQRL